MAQEQKMTVEQQQQWIREQYQIATKYLASQGLVTNSVSAEESRYFMNFMSVWKLKALDSKYYWVICGDLPSDYNGVDVAGNARDAARHFSLKWQMQAEGLLQTGEKEQEKFAKVLISKAEVLYDLVAQDNLWEIKP